MTAWCHMESVKQKKNDEKKKKITPVKDHPKKERKLASCPERILASLSQCIFPRSFIYLLTFLVI